MILTRARGARAARIAALAGLVAGIGAAQAQAPAADTNCTLAAAVDLAVRDNAQLKSLRSKWEAMQERPAQAGALPNPMFTYSGMDTASGGTWPGTGEKRFMVQQEFPAPGKRGLRAGMAAKDAEVMQRELEAMTRDVVMMVKAGYYDLYAVQQALSITREEQGVLQRMEKIAGAMYATGDRPQADVIKAQAETTMLKQKLLELQARETTLTARLNTLFNRQADSPLGPAVPPPEIVFRDEPGALLAQAATNSPEVRAAQAGVERSELELRLMAKESLPGYKLGVEYRDIDGSDDMAMFTVGVELPFWNAKNRAGVREAERMRASGLAAREDAERQNAFDVRDAAFQLQTARRSLALYRTELIPQAAARLSASEAGYRTGKVDFMDLLESERFLLDAKVMAVMTEGAVGMQAARLERATGAAWPRSGGAGEE